MAILQSANPAMIESNVSERLSPAKDKAMIPLEVYVQSIVQNNDECLFDCVLFTIRVKKKKKGNLQHCSSSFA